MEDDWEEEGEPQVEEEEQEEEDILDTGDGGEEARETEGLLMRFCPHDSSMLYPKVRTPLSWTLFMLVCV